MSEKQSGFFSRVKSGLSSGLSKTRDSFSNGLGRVFLGRKNIDDDLFEEIETLLLSSDVGVTATTEIIDLLTQKVARKELNDPEALFSHLKQALAACWERQKNPSSFPKAISHLSSSW